MKRTVLAVLAGFLAVVLIGWPTFAKRYSQHVDTCALMSFSDDVQLDRLLLPTYSWDMPKSHSRNRSYLESQLEKGSVQLRELGDCEQTALEPTPMPSSAIDRSVELNELGYGSQRFGVRLLADDEYECPWPEGCSGMLVVPRNDCRQAIVLTMEAEASSVKEAGKKSRRLGYMTAVVGPTREGERVVMPLRRITPEEHEISFETLECFN